MLYIKYKHYSHLKVQEINEKLKKRKEEKKPANVLGAFFQKRDSEKREKKFFQP